MVWLVLFLVALVLAAAFLIIARKGGSCAHSSRCRRKQPKRGLNGTDESRKCSAPFISEAGLTIRSFCRSQKRNLKRAFFTTATGLHFKPCPAAAKSWSTDRKRSPDISATGTR